MAKKFVSVLEDQPVESHKVGPVEPKKKRSKGPSKADRRGCEYCPADQTRGLRKVMGHVYGREIFLWARNPGGTENDEGQELVGKAGQWLWKEMKRVGITRKMCDIQNVMRCWSVDREGGQLVPRDPTKEELHCCSLYTDLAIPKSRAKVHLVFGKVAAAMLFGRTIRKDTKVFWADKLKGKVFILDHPSYFVRGAPNSRLAEFRRKLDHVAVTLDGPAGKFGYIEAQNYQAIMTAERAETAAIEIRQVARKRRVSVDMEDDIVDGKRVCLCVGFGTRPGKAFVFVIDHPETGISSRDRKGIIAVVVDLLEDENIRKCMQRGMYDVEQSRKLLGARIRGFDYDTNYAEFFAFPGRPSLYSLEATALARFPEFAGYKQIIQPEAAPVDGGGPRLSKLPLKRLVTYNGADCDLTKRIEVTTKSKVPLPLLQVYMDAGVILKKMEPNGPLFDKKQYAALKKIWPPRVAELKRGLQVVAGDPEFNPGSPTQVGKVIYEKLDLRLESDEDARDTQKRTMELLALQHSFPGKVLEWRRGDKVEAYLDGYHRSAELHNGRLQTFWWMTGAGTGRLSSGSGKRGGKKSEEVDDRGIVNLQNVHGDPQMKNLLVSDLRWRQVAHAETITRSMYDIPMFLMLDYSQNEVRMLAQDSGDPLLMKFFRAREDIHAMVGHEITGWEVEKIKKDKGVRKLVKNFHFGIIFGLQGPGLQGYLQAQGVRLSLEETNLYLKRYFKRFPGVADYIKRRHMEAAEEGSVTSIFGFRRPLDTSGDRSEGAAWWKNQAVNTPIQGAAHHLLLMAIAVMMRKSRTYKLLGIPHMEVHDSLVCSNPLRDMPEAFVLAKRLMEEEVLDVIRNDFGVDWKVPLLAEASVGYRFGVPVDYEGSDDLKGIIRKWQDANDPIEADLRRELAKVA